MTTRGFALIFGVVFGLVGIAGFVPSLVTAVHGPHPPLAVETGYGLLLGLFPINLLHNLVHVLFGLWGLIGSRSIVASKFYARSVAVIYAVLSIAGLVPGLDTLFGLTPLFGNDVWLHALLALIAAYFGWLHREVGPASRM
ncbi:hypothetical protein GCM10011494_33270 [Novosphingobium endophyticum]|uniref:DUF4383 domain-containing protein n=1 Tax=Novosphingobium endophyticum TaxID=1955250 RepID=A0A916X5S6_9SPHN|nr:DUF4383 domain-containing protein [Novosphingobium endophyticum]GGC11798.1 hypothetical protein GCM10011494_33270 [Novosphingobium endophyticum]